MNNLQFGPGALIFISAYLLGLLMLGFIAKRARRDDSLSEFYLAGKSLGGLVLLLTLYATQYSGNTLLGYPGETYRLGFGWVMSVGFMMSIVVVYLLFAPQLYRLAKKHSFVTPGDWIQHRFRSRKLTGLTNALLIISIVNFLLAQLIAMGHVVEGLSGGRIPYWSGVIFLAFIVLVYETLGGMRAVAWTDCVQGMILLIGLVGLLWIVIPDLETLGSITQWIAQNQPEKSAPPSGSLLRTWISTLLLVAFGGAVYPQAIQRIYAAKSERSLKASLSLMVFMPFLSTLIVFLVGVIGIQHFAGLGDIAADQVMPLLLQEWAGQSTVLYWFIVVVVTAILAAIMSTADSVLLSLSSMLARDVVGATILKRAPEARITGVGKQLSMAIMCILVLVALSPWITLWGLTEFKMELLAQAAPAFILGLIWSRLTAEAAFVGMLAGTVLSVGLTMMGFGKVWDFHAGLVGLAVNIACCVCLSLLTMRSLAGKKIL